jgi:hypothetical protein
MMISIRNIGLLLFLGALLLLPYHIALSGNIQVKKQTKTRQSMFDPFGLYTILDNKNDAFKEIYNIQLQLLEKPIKGKPWKIAGHVQFGETLFAAFSETKLTETTLSFTTEEEEGTSYVFEGRFLRKGDFSILPTDIPVLEGTLIRKVKGKEVAKENLKFDYFDPDK